MKIGDRVAWSAGYVRITGPRSKEQRGTVLSFNLGSYDGATAKVEWREGDGRFLGTFDSPLKLLVKEDSLECELRPTSWSH